MPRIKASIKGFVQMNSFLLKMYQQRIADSKDRAKETDTSSGVWTPRYIREKPTRKMITKHRTVCHFFLAESASVPKRAVMLWV